MTRLPMFLARSPMRSRSLETRNAPTISRKSTAMGWRRAIGITLCERIDRIRNQLLRKTTHLRHQAGELLQIDVEGLRGVIGYYHLRRPGWRTVRFNRSGP